MMKLPTPKITVNGRTLAGRKPDWLGVVVGPGILIATLVLTVWRMATR